VPPFTGLRFSSREKSGGRLPPTRTPCYARSTFYAVEKDRSEMANLCYEGHEATGTKVSNGEQFTG
jgi:hypothetical protein